MREPVPRRPTASTEHKTPEVRSQKNQYPVPPTAGYPASSDQYPASSTMSHIGQYIPGESIIHRLDPRVKIGSVVALSLLILRGDLLWLGLTSALIMALVPVSRITPREMARALRPVLFFFVLLFMLHLLFTEGTPIPPFPSWPVTMTYQGLFMGIMTTWQFLLLIMSASILTMTTSPADLVCGIERLLRPLRLLGVPSHDMAVMVSIALRFIPTFLEEIDRIREAQAARGADLGSGSLIRRIRSAVSLSVPLVLSSLRRADELALAMEARGYKRGPRTYMRDLSMGRADYIAVAMMALMTSLRLFQAYS